ncbi:UDP-N-acetylmuramoylalanyl-D-glutamate--2,6-diaminopimelate ligase [Tamilnaduibacter salinus]|uniref:UDP-N-acetylmuramoyl-L-alanyl-D-glutamate--2,6-diaminopimelate ligase n=1 Tax=Tamilnaduibacter salinus TaxID=1484056 RepID=A0A2A2I426_9GAMM|nr:UDP-N-acetylmuramoyl-L-alanyl-D-glutamate--2,6-diaminopimelate ligase [Tamilnaduibacter salinus]PAV26044.1 UDP-N-acetylmuramoyl-L-alanyl-D-glutamate--2,6-diaminopimelate ligase [Tamilnaduibacter salinus]PVY78821.1 UDP-N-acetylmuramoylalanyl-D-glutamate--2,6-diaminopimelate ligase [Tamilnaduibacter salinus]
MYLASLSELLHPVVDVPSVFDVTVHGLTSDSRDVQPGDAFVALPGARTSADQYMDDAIHRGAVAVLLAGGNAGRCREHHGALVVDIPDLRRHLGWIADRFFQSPSRALDVIGVTGTNGKTSVTHYISQLLSHAGHDCGVVGTLGYGMPGHLKPATHTTPDVIRINEALDGIRERGGKAAAMEVSSHALDQGRVNNLTIRGAVLTNLSRDHLDYHGSMEAYGEAKALLFHRESVDFAVLNFDDPFGRQLYSQLDGQCDRVRYTLHEPQTELWLTRYAAHIDGFEAQLDGDWGAFELTVPLMGRFNVSNALAAVATALSLGLSVDAVRTAAARLVAPPGRLESFAGASGVRVVVDYAHTADALRNALEALRDHVEGTLWCVFGCGGDRDAGKRPDMAREAEAVADRVLVTDDNPRNEDPEAITNDILAGFGNPAAVTVIHDREAAIRDAVMNAQPGDVVLVAGKGHETTQEVAGEHRYFSDASVVRQVLVDREGAA